MSLRVITKRLPSVKLTEFYFTHTLIKHISALQWGTNPRDITRVGLQPTTHSPLQTRCLPLDHRDRTVAKSKIKLLKLESHKGLWRLCILVDHIQGLVSLLIQMWVQILGTVDAVSTFKNPISFQSCSWDMVYVLLDKVILGCFQGRCQDGQTK